MGKLNSPGALPLLPIVLINSPFSSVRNMVIFDLFVVILDKNWSACSGDRAILSIVGKVTCSIRAMKRIIYQVFKICYTQFNKLWRRLKIFSPWIFGLEK